MKALTVGQLQAGMELARTVVNDDMVVILSENTLLTKAHITRLSFLNIPQVYVKDEYELSPNYQSVMTIFNRNCLITLMVNLVVCLALAVTVLLAKLVGAILPLGAAALKLDPAVMASPFITSIVDALSLLVYFLFAQLLLGV